MFILISVYMCVYVYTHVLTDVFAVHICIIDIYVNRHVTKAQMGSRGYLSVHTHKHTLSCRQTHVVVSVTLFVCTHVHDTYTQLKRMHTAIHQCMLFLCPLHPPNNRSPLDLHMAPCSNESNGRLRHGSAALGPLQSLFAFCRGEHSDHGKRML